MLPSFIFKSWFRRDSRYMSILVPLSTFKLDQRAFCRAQAVENSLSVSPDDACWVKDFFARQLRMGYLVGFDLQLLELVIRY